MVSSVSSSSSNLGMVMGSKGVVIMLEWIQVLLMLMLMGCMDSFSSAHEINIEMGIHLDIDIDSMTMEMEKGKYEEEKEEEEGKRERGCMSMPYMVVLGASMVDAGENAIAMPYRSNAKYPPYGIDYFGKPTARFSNGRLFVDFLSQELGFGLLHPYLKSVGADFTHGINFASSGSTIQNTTINGNGSSSCGLFSFLVQVDQLRQFKDEVATIFQHVPPLQERNMANLPTMETLEEAVVLIETGLNDYNNIDLDIHELVKVVESIVTILESGIRSVLELGMKKFVVMNLYPRGCAPAIKRDLDVLDAKTDVDGCNIKGNQVSDLHNKKLSELLHKKLALEYPSATFLIFDANSLFLHAIRNPSIYGLKHPLEACLEHFDNGENIPRGESGYIKEGKTYYVSKRCEDPSLYLSWDGIHPTETFAHHMANNILTGSFLLPPSFKIQKSCTTAS